jgi:hypothetical protein
MMGGKPGRERPMSRAELLDALSVGDGGFHLEAIPDYPGVSEEPVAVLGSITRHRVYVEAGIRPPECLTLLEDRQPGEPGLVDLEYETLE